MTAPHSDQPVTADSSFRSFGTNGLSHLPGLDGLRGFAVAAVVLFHGNFTWAKGGYLGVSLFFTLSGFLITSLILARTMDGNMLPKGFWVARGKRLLPAAWLTLLAIVGASWFLDEQTVFESNRTDALFALGQVANWRLMFEETSYGDLFSAPSPVIHFWSLAIEEQFYLVFPFLIAAISYLFRRSRPKALAFLLVGAITSWLLPLIFNFSVDRVYFGTDTRAGELLAGAALAVWISDENTRHRLSHRLYWRGVVAAVGVVALGAGLAAIALLPQSSDFLRLGGLAVISLTSVTLIVAAAVPAGPIGLLFELAPLRWLGTVSYGIYLFHWPIFVYATPQRFGLDPTGWGRTIVFVGSVAITLVLAQLSFMLVERPIRRADLSVPKSRRVVVGSGVATLCCLLVGATLVPARNVDTAIDFDAASEALADLNRRSSATSSPPSTVPTAPAGSTPLGETTTTVDLAAVPNFIPRVGFFGDSVSLTLGIMLDAARPAGVTVVGGSANLGCSLVRGGKRLFITLEAADSECDDWETTYPEAVTSTATDLAVVTSGQWEIVERLIDGETEPRVIGDPVLDQLIYDEFLKATDTLIDAGAKVVWLTLANYGPQGDSSQPAGVLEARVPARVEALNSIIERVVEARSVDARLIDLAAYMEPNIDSETLRSDGSHYVADPDNPVADFLEEQLIAAWVDLNDPLER